MKTATIRFASKIQFVALMGLLIAVPQLAFGVVPVVKTVPFDATNFAIPHDTYAGKSLTLKGTSNVAAANFTYDWDPGDGSAHSTGTVTNQYVVQATHIYAGAVGSTWTAVLTITDTNNGDHASANFPVIMRANNLTSNVNVAIDEGLWYLHKTMQRYTVGVIDEGDWDNLAPTVCIAGDQACDNVNNAPAVNADNVQAFEVSGHLESGPAADPYTEDVARGMKRLFSQLAAGAISNKTISFNAPPSCPAAPCTYNPDTNGNGLGVFVETAANTNRQFYQGGQYMDAIVASGTPAAVTTTGPANIIGRSYLDIVQDMVDAYAFCQYSFAPGGGWYYSCNGFIDNSVAQWAAIGLIGAKAFGATVPAIVLDANKINVANTEAANGEFGYQSTSPIWGPFAVTPSGMVQMALDGIGRGSTAWDHSETFIRDNFDNSVAGCGGNAQCAAGLNVKSYVYGLFSFTKSMLLHNVGGALQPITLLQSKTAGINPIDWYSAEAANGATSDGVARTLVNRQDPAGFWIGHSFVSNHFPFETSWSIIMLRRTVFIACVSTLQGKGTPSGRAAARIDLTWTGISNVDHYNVLRGTVAGGPYNLVGSSKTTAFSDTTAGLVNGHTYFYVLQPINSNNSEICQSNEATVTIPASGR